MKRLQFAVAELEVISGIVDNEGESILLQQLHTLTEQVRECISSVLNTSKVFGSPPA